MGALVGAGAVVTLDVLADTLEAVDPVRFVGLVGQAGYYIAHVDGDDGEQGGGGGRDGDDGGDAPVERYVYTFTGELYRRRRGGGWSRTTTPWTGRQAERLRSTC